jgi:hypothetical protein
MNWRVSGGSPEIIAGELETGAMVIVGLLVVAGV